MKFPVTVQLRERASKAEVSARIVRTEMDHILEWSDWPYPDDAMDRTWNWLELYLDSVRRPQQYECFSLVAQDELHGLMLLDIRGILQRRVRWLVVDYLATNPADRHDDRGLKGLGSTMIAVAIERSLECQMEGRLRLVSLPAPETEGFYEELGFDLLLRLSPEGWKQYKLDANTAKAVLAEVKERRRWNDAEEI